MKSAIIVILLLMLALPVSLMAQTDGITFVDSKAEGSEAAFKPYLELFLGGSYRLDATHLEHTPGLEIGGLYRHTAIVATRMMFAMNWSTKFDGALQMERVRVSSTVLEAGLRISNNLDFAEIYWEPGIGLSYYRSNDEYGVSDFRFGASLGGGVAISIGERMKLDLNIRHIRNRPADDIVFTMDPGYGGASYWPPGLYTDRFSSDLYNPTILGIKLTRSFK